MVPTLRLFCAYVHQIGKTFTDVIISSLQKSLYTRTPPILTLNARFIISSHNRTSATCSVMNIDLIKGRAILP